MVCDALKGSTNYLALFVFCVIGIFTISFLMIVAYRLTEESDYSRNDARETIVPRVYYVVLKYSFLLIGLSILVVGLKYNITVEYDAGFLPVWIGAAGASILLSYSCHYLLNASINWCGVFRRPHCLPRCRLPDLSRVTAIVSSVKRS